MNLSDAITQWLAHRWKMVGLDLLAESTYLNQGKIGGVLKHHLGDIDLDALRKSQVEIYIGMRKRACEPITIQGELSVLSQILNWCVDEQLLGKKPRLPTVKVEDTEQPLPADAAFLWVLRWLPENHSRALEFMMLTGLAPHELDRTRAGDRLGDGLHIGRREDFKVKQPSRKRLVPLNGRAAVLWDQAALGMRHDGKPWPSVGAMEKAIQRLKLDPVASTGGTYCPAGVEHITPKTMRKWFASKVASEQPEHVLQRLLGHAPGSPITRKHYVRSSDAQLVGAVEGLKA